MCFSAPVSFTAAAGLTATGLFGIYFALRANKRFFALNVMILFYAIQQFSEGMIWIHSPIFTPSFWGMLFLFFAFFVYPWYAGLSCYFLTRQLPLKKKIACIIGLGFLFGLWAFSNVLLTPNLALAQCHLHIFYNVHLIGGYQITSPFVIYGVIPVYVFLTSAPFFISDRRYLSWVGWGIVISSVICWFIYLNYFVSVWCFYSAVIAGTVSIVTYLQWWKKRLTSMSTTRHVAP